MDAGILQRKFDDYEGQIEHVESVPATESQTEPAATVVPDAVAESLPYDGLFTHQANGLRQLAAGEDICVTTQTSSGKTLIYALDIARKQLESPDSTALLVYPTKALSRDQRDELDKLYETLGIDIEIGVYDGDTDRGRKREIRNTADIIITNFQGLNYYLPYHQKWARIFRNLDTIVVDESHSYTGVEGMHVAWIMRRLRRIAENTYNATPQLILSSATIGNPAEHGKNLTGRDVTIVSDDGSPRGTRDIVIWNPPSYVGDNGQLSRRSSHRESSDILAHLVSEDSQSLMFAPSRKMTELCAKWTEDTLNNDYVGQNRYVEPYNAGHRQDERRDVETALKSGKADAVVSTTALELGIDIGEVDTTLLDGYPNRRCSFWQQIGRSGRGEQDSLSVMVARHDSIDQYIVDNPGFLFDEDVENAVIDLSNQSVLKMHLLAAANESPLDTLDTLMFGIRRFSPAVEQLKNDDMLEGELDDGVQYTGPDRPEANIDVYSTGEDQYEVIVETDTGSFTLPPVDKSRAFREFHPDAVYIHKGQQYRVVSLDQHNSTVTLEKADVGYHTQATRDVTITNLRSQESTEVANGITVRKGTATIEERYSNYKRIYHHGGNSDDQYLPTTIDTPVELNTELMWIEVTEPVLGDIHQEHGGDGLAGSLHAAEHALIKMSPTVITADTQDLGGLSTPQDATTGEATVFIYEGIEGGVGFSHAIYDQLQLLAERTDTMLNRCDCSAHTGCPACTMSPMCGDDNEPMDSPGARELLSTIAAGDAL